jgi:O-antigen/teichoic acid export membrane protein
MATTPPAVDVDIGGQTSIWRHIRRDVVLLGAGNIAILIAQLGFRGILVTALVPASYGRLSLVLGIYNTAWIIGASGLPNSVARYLAINGPQQDSAIIRSAILAGVLPTLVATILTAIASGIILGSQIAGLLAAVGLSSMVYSLLTMGILRGRGRVGLSASIAPIAAVSEVAPLAILVLTGIGVTTLSAFAVFCTGNVLGLIVGIFFTFRTTPKAQDAIPEASENVTPTPRKLLAFSLWLAAATAGIAVLPLIVRFAATLDSYTLVAIIDVALILFTIPQRIGTVIVLAVIPHASRALGKAGVNLSLSVQEHLKVTLPFVAIAAIVAFSPLAEWFSDLIARPVYARSANYLALALLAGPARILYGLVEGVLIAHGEGRFLAFTALSITALASIIIFTIMALGSPIVAFAVFVIAFWLIYLIGIARVNRLERLKPTAAG